MKFILIFIVGLFSAFVYGFIDENERDKCFGMMCGKESYVINIDKATNSITVIASRLPDGYKSLNSNLIIKTNNNLSQKKFKVGNEQFLYEIPYMSYKDKHEIDMIYPDGKEIKLYYKYIDLSKEQNLDKLRKLPQGKNVEMFLDPIKKYDEDGNIDCCYSTLRYYIEYN